MTKTTTTSDKKSAAELSVKAIIILQNLGWYSPWRMHYETNKLDISCEVGEKPNWKSAVVQVYSKPISRAGQWKNKMILKRGVYVRPGRVVQREIDVVYDMALNGARTEYHKKLEIIADVYRRIDKLNDERHKRWTGDRDLGEVSLNSRCELGKTNDIVRHNSPDWIR
ncbi:MAG: hypothetical protein ABH864_04860 [archaeon]